MSLRLTALHRYPVKSMRGEPLTRAEVEPWGLAGDRRWMLVDDAGTAITAREVNALLLVDPRLTGDGLVLAAPGLDPLDVRRPGPEAPQVPVALWSSRLAAADAGDAARDWCTSLLGRPARLVHLDDPTTRPTDPGFSEDDDRVSFADGYPMLLTTQESLAALDDEVLADGGVAGGSEPLVMQRFRPNLVVAGAPAWAEDDWRRLRIGEVTFRAVKGCARCVMTTVDPDTAERGKEPVRSLARIRRYDGQTWFGVNLVPDTPLPAGASLEVGAEIEVLDAVAPGDGPIRVPRPAAHGAAPPAP